MAQFVKWRQVPHGIPNRAALKSSVESLCERETHITDSCTQEVADTDTTMWYQ